MDGWLVSWLVGVLRKEITTKSHINISRGIGKFYYYYFSNKHNRQVHIEYQLLLLSALEKEQYRYLGFMMVGSVRPSLC